MKSNLQVILSCVNEQLQLLEQTTKDPVLLAELVTQLIKSTIQLIDESIINNGFPCLKDEIHFFKIEKPQLMSSLFYHNCVYKLETFKPKHGKKEVKEYLLNKKGVIKLFSDDNQEFYNYHLSKSNRLDAVYFVRGNFDIKTNNTSMYLMVDERFCTYHCFLTAKIQANLRFSAYINNSLCKLKNGSTSTSLAINEGAIKDKLIWTGSKTELIELIYALVAAKVFNKGETELKKIVKAVEELFHIDLGQYSSTRIDIKNRKTGQTKFMDTLKDYLLQSFEEF